MTTSLSKIRFLIFSIVFLASQTSVAESLAYKTVSALSPAITENFLLASNDKLSADQAANIAKQGKDSKVLKVTKSFEGSREIYRVKLLTAKGHVRHILIDANSGEVIQGIKK